MAAPVYCDSTAQPDASPYFAAFGREPILPGGESEVTPKPIARMTFLSLLDALIKSQGKEKNFGIVCHGLGSGLNIPLAPRVGEILADQALTTFKGNLARQQSDSEAAADLKMDVKTFGLLKENLQRVRRMTLQRLMIRGCIIGSYPDTLGRFRDLFGVAAVCGPTDLDLFGHVSPTVARNASDFDEWQKVHAFARVDGSKGRRVGIEWTQGAGATGELSAMVESTEALRAWVGEKLPGTYKGGPLLLHAFVIGGRNLIFPREKGYRDHLKSSSSAP